MNYHVADPDWGWWVIGYFFLGGIAAGSYFVATLLEWFGAPEDRKLAQVAYWVAFPLVVVCGVFLILDLDQPTRFWHMLFKSEVMKDAVAQGFPRSGAGWRRALEAPLLKYWSPMSAGSWGLTLFGACAFVSFVGAVWPARWPGRVLPLRWLRRPFQLVGCAAAFFVASYTGALLSASNQPVWSDTVWLAPLFLASAASTSLALMSLVAWRADLATPEARACLHGAEPLALGLELVLFGAFLASLGEHLEAVLLTARGNVLVFGTLGLAILAPLLLHGRFGHRVWWGVPSAALCALAGGLLFRYAIVTTPGELLRRGPSAAVRFAPEMHRLRGQPGADVNNRGPGSPPRSKLPLEEP